MLQRARLLASRPRRVPAPLPGPDTPEVAPQGLRPLYVCLGLRFSGHSAAGDGPSACSRRCMTIRAGHPKAMAVHHSLQEESSPQSSRGQGPGAPTGGKGLAGVRGSQGPGAPVTFSHMGEQTGLRGIQKLPRALNLPPGMWGRLLLQDDKLKHTQACTLTDVHEYTPAHPHPTHVCTQPICICTRTRMHTSAHTKENPLGS